MGLLVSSSGNDPPRLSFVFHFNLVCIIVEADLIGRSSTRITWKQYAFQFRKEWVQKKLLYTYMIRLVTSKEICWCDAISPQSSNPLLVQQTAALTSKHLTTLLRNSPHCVCVDFSRISHFCSRLPFIYIYLYVRMYVRTYVCMYVCVYVCMHACMHVCMYVYLFIHLFIYLYLYLYLSLSIYRPLSLFFCMCKLLLVLICYILSYLNNLKNIFKIS